jgi:tripartite-type tricarboxylate transporter receptor subunit TctC
MALTRRTALLASALLLAAPCRLRAQERPTRPVRILCPFLPGGTADLVARFTAEGMSPLAGQPVLVENRSGASGFVAAEAVARAPADGHTLLLTSTGIMSQAPEVPGSVIPIDINQDLRPVANLAGVPFVLIVYPGLPIRTVPELVAAARATPGQLSYATSGVGSGPHLAAKLFEALTGVELLHVPYRGGAQAATDMDAGRVSMSFALLPESLARVRAGAMRPIAMLTPERHPALPEVPPITDSVPDYRNNYWYGLAGPAGLSEAWTEFWNRVANQALASPDLVRRFTEQTLIPLRGSPADFRDTIAADRAVWAKVIRDAKIRAD